MALTFRNRILGTFTLGIAAALAVAGCGSSSTSTTSDVASSAPAVPSASPSSAPSTPVASGELTIWTEDYYVKIFEPLVKPWAEMNGLTVTFVTKDFGQMGDQFIAAVPAGEGPDLFITPTGTNKFVANGVVAPVELGDAAAGFNPVSIEAVSNGGKIYGVPFTVENIAYISGETRIIEGDAVEPYWDAIPGKSRAYYRQSDKTGDFHQFVVLVTKVTKVVLSRPIAYRKFPVLDPGGAKH